MVNLYRKEDAKKYINNLAESVQYWTIHCGIDSEITKRCLARYVNAKLMYAVLTGEEYTGVLI